MSMVPRCSDCDDLLTLCRCDGNPNPIYRPSFVEKYERERFQWDIAKDGKSGSVAA